MPRKEALTHDQIRKLICLVCASKQKNARPLQEKERGWLTEHWLSGVDFMDRRLPSAICINCRYALEATATLAEGIDTPERASRSRKLPEPSDSFFSGLVRGPITKSQSEAMSSPRCGCPLCQMGRQSGRQKATEDTKTQHAKQKNAGTPLLCSACGSIYARGHPHACLTGQMAANLMKTLAKDVRQQLAAATIREAMSETNESTVQLKNTSGRPMTVTSQSRQPTPASACGPDTGARSKVREKLTQSEPRGSTIQGMESGPRKKASVPTEGPMKLRESLDRLSLDPRRKLFFQDSLKSPDKKKRRGLPKSNLHEPLHKQALSEPDPDLLCCA